MNKITNIELFAGAGGLALGLEQAGIEGVEFVEFNHAACDTLRKNRPNWNVVEGDVHGVDFTQYHGKVDLVSGGAPCQAFSYAGKKLGFGDTRGTLFAEFARCVEEVSPKMFLFENVRGLLSHDNWPDVRYHQAHVRGVGIRRPAPCLECLLFWCRTEARTSHRHRHPQRPGR